MSHAIQDSDFQDAADSEAVTRMLMQLFEHWQLTYGQQASLLGISKNTNATIARYKRGDSRLALDRDRTDRVGHLFAIHKLLRSIFPMNRDLAYAWITRRNKAFENLTPLEHVEKYGFYGLVQVRHYLEKKIVE